MIALLQDCKPQYLKGGKDKGETKEEGSCGARPQSTESPVVQVWGPQPGQKRGLIFYSLNRVHSWAPRPPPYYSHLSHGCLRQSSGELGRCDFSGPWTVKDMTSSALSALSLLIAGTVNPPAPPCGNQVELLRNRGFPIGEVS